MVRIQIANQTGTAEALLNDTVATRDFARRLPCTLVAVPVEDGYEAVTAKGCYDPMESVDHFASGDLVWSGGKLLFCAMERAVRRPGGIMVIGHMKAGEAGWQKLMGEKLSLAVIHETSRKGE